MNTLDTLYSSSSTKFFLVQDNNSNTYLVQEQLDNSWYLCKLLVALPGTSYGADYNFIIVKGDTSIWVAL